MIYTPPIKDMLFLLNEWIGLEKLTALPGYEEVDGDLIEAILEEAGKFCTTELLDINRDGDEHGAVHDGDSVRTPPGFREAYRQSPFCPKAGFREAYARFIENGWTGIDANPDHGGQGLPKLLQSLIDEMLSATNLSFKMYSELSHAAYHLLDDVAGDDIRGSQVAFAVFQIDLGNKHAFAVDQFKLHHGPSGDIHNAQVHTGDSGIHCEDTIGRIRVN